MSIPWIGVKVQQESKIVIAEDHTILREGLRALLSSEPALQVVGEARDGREAIRRVEQLSLILSLWIFPCQE